ncbi:MAG: tetratricopeptide repeat protein [Chitinophagaceae bacterium]|nr:tetratricopeptide repeat protein [Chitinophagaceae bacterium]
MVSGLLAAGPNIVVQRNDAWKMIIDNAQLYLNYFFPGEVGRSRPLFTGKGFEAVSAAIAKDDYEAALTESLRMINDPKKEIAAKALYNCAVLFERKNQPEEALNYAKQSVDVYDLREARLLWNDLAQ